MDNWNFYQANINDQIASIYLNLALADKAPNPNLPKLAWYWIKLDHPREDGLSSDEDFDALNAHEDDLVLCLSSSPSEYVGRVTTQGRREFYFYTPTEISVNELLKEFVGQKPKFQYQLGEKADPNWHQYFYVLYPGPNGLEQIGKRNK